MKLKLNPLSSQRLSAQLRLTGTFSVTLQTSDDLTRIRGTLRIDQGGDTVRLQLRALDTTNTCSLPAGQAITTLHAAAQGFIEDSANGRGLGVAA